MINCNAENDRWKMLGFAMHCSGLVSRLLDLKYKRNNVDKTPAGDQLRLFHLTLEEGEEFRKFAKNLRWLISDNIGDDFWEGYREHQYTDSEFRTLFDPLYREKTEAAIALIEKVGNGEELTEEETAEAMNFLHMLGGHAHARTDRGGCF